MRRELVNSLTKHLVIRNGIYYYRIDKRQPNGKYKAFRKSLGTKLVQETINEATNDKVSVDGIIGDETLKVLNNIPDDKVDDFMDALKEKRLEYLQGLDTWDEYGRGWTKRTNKY